VRSARRLWCGRQEPGPNPLLKSLPVEKDKRGRPGCWEHARVARLSRGVGPWVIVPHLPMRARESPVRPLLNFAVREAEVLAEKYLRGTSGRTQESFSFDSLGALWRRGHQSACAELAIPFVRTSPCAFPDWFACSYGEEITFRKFCKVSGKKDSGAGRFGRSSFSFPARYRSNHRFTNEERSMSSVQDSQRSGMTAADRSIG